MKLICVQHLFENVGYHFALVSIFFSSKSSHVQHVFWCLLETINKSMGIEFISKFHLYSHHLIMKILFVCGISLTSGQLINELFPDCLKVMLFASCFTTQGQ